MTKWFFICPKNNPSDAAGFEERADAIEEAKNWISYDPEMEVLLFEATEIASIYLPDPEPVIDYYD